MPGKKFSHSEIARITGASRHESVPVPFYYAPPFLDQLQEFIESRLFSTGGRPTIKGAEIVRKVRFTKKHWHKLEALARKMNQTGTSVTPAQIASSILDQVLESAKVKA